MSICSNFNRNVSNYSGKMAVKLSGKHKLPSGPNLSSLKRSGSLNKKFEFLYLAY